MSTGYGSRYSARFDGIAIDARLNEKIIHADGVVV